MKQVHTALNHIMRRAVDLGFIIANPVDKVSKPKAGEGNRKSLDFEQANRLRKKIDEAWHDELNDYNEKEQRQRDRQNNTGRSYIRDIKPLSCVIASLLGLATGARRGEVLSLTWADINLDDATVRVNKTITSEMQIKSPKTKAGVRTMAIDAGTVQMLIAWKDTQRKILAQLEQVQGAHTPVCIGSTGRYIEPHNFSGWWRRFCVRVGFEGLRFHELRHTQATLLLAKRTDIKTVSSRLGHSSAAITLDMYSHAMPETDREAANALSEIFTQEISSDKVAKIA